MSGRVSEFLGDTPGRTIIKLAIISFAVGVILSALNLTPFELWEAIRNFAIRLYDLGFEAVWRIAKYFVWGAIVVVPIFIALRILKFRR